MEDHVANDFTLCGHAGKPPTTRRSKSRFPATHKEGASSCAGLPLPPIDLINLFFFTVFLLLSKDPFILIMIDSSDYEFEDLITRKAVKDIIGFIKSLEKIIQAAQKD